MSDVDDQAIALRDRVEGRRGTGAPYGPGSYTFWALAHHIHADDVRFSDVKPAPDTTYNDRSGRLVLVSDEALIVCQYAHAVEHVDYDTGDYGTLSVRWHSRAGQPVDIEWRDRSLWIPKDVGRHVAPSKLAAGAITVSGTWGPLDLPGESVRDADAYFAELRSALTRETDSLRQGT